MLFIGESPPASGRFFYHRDSGLYRATCDAFQIIDPAINDENFLAAFQAMGCYLIDLCPDPVDRLDPPSRRAACRAGEAIPFRNYQLAAATGGDRDRSPFDRSKRGPRSVSRLVGWPVPPPALPGTMVSVQGGLRGRTCSRHFFSSAFGCGGLSMIGVPFSP